MSLYSALVCATNVLRTGVLALHGMIQLLGEPPAETETIYRSSSSAKGGDSVLCFHRLKQPCTPTPWASIRPHPVSLAGSTEFDITGAALRQTEAEATEGAAAELSKHDSDDDLAALTKSPWAVDMDMSTEEDDDSVMNLSSTRSSSNRQSHPTSQPSSWGSFDLAAVYLDVGRSGEMNAEFAMDSDLNVHSPMDYNLTLPSPPVSPPRPRHMSSRSPFETQQPSDDPCGRPTWASSVNGEQGSGEMADVVNVVSSGLVKDVLAVDLIPGPIIGKGSEGHVLKMSYHTTPVAVKIMNNKTLRTRERFKNETKLLSKLSDHENIVRFVGQCRDLKAGDESAAADLVMVMEFCELGNLYKIISEAK